MSKRDSLASGPNATGEGRPSRASAARFSLYLRRLERIQHTGISTVSSGQLGQALGITDAQVRKDLANLGSLGHPGIGYPTAELIGALRRVERVLERTPARAIAGSIRIAGRKP